MSTTLPGWERRLGSQGPTRTAHGIVTELGAAAEWLGLASAVIYLVDVQEQSLVPLLGRDGPGQDRRIDLLGVDSTLAGRCFQLSTVLAPEQDATPHQHETWVPLLDGVARYGVLGVRPTAEGWPADVDHATLEHLAALTAQALARSTRFDDALVRVRRRSSMGLAAEIQWGLLPSLTFSSGVVTVAAALEPAYEVAGDSVDYAVDGDVTRVGVFDGMGHGLQSAQLSALTVAAYRNARRNGLSLAGTADFVDDAVAGVFDAQSFVTGALLELDHVSGRLSCLSAGHPPVLVCRGGQVVRSIEPTPRVPFGLGVLLDPEDPVAEPWVEQLEPGDVVFAHTDGITEARGPDGEFYGTDRMYDVLGRSLNDGLGPAETLRRMVRALLDHQQGPLDDDATLLMVRWTPEQVESATA